MIWIKPLPRRTALKKKKRKINDETYLQALFDWLQWNQMYKIHLRKKREFKLRKRYILNLLNEPQHLAKIKTPKLLKFQNKGVTNLRDWKLKNNRPKVRKNKQKGVLWHDWPICKITRATRENKKKTKGEQEEKHCYLKFKNERDFLHQNQSNHNSQSERHREPIRTQ